ncbi:hypothetical protein llap_5051 [Limosa lapponica baueri]|uniref:Uncharacterized protein n=1 Tax=Limosa lapponica baueri TaxID=1758121 RepID=A0A2I0UEZ4_LIMLA|nr:hypothetical protein llap_5051 [Limosa lapponica baueri]
MNESWRAGVSGGNHLSLSETVKDFANLYIELKGEVEQPVTHCTPFLDKPIQLKFKTLSVPQPSDNKAQELLGDDVQPFSLDEEFDYDNVALTPKFSEAELKAIMGLSEEKKMGTDVTSA